MHYLPIGWPWLRRHHRRGDAQVCGFLLLLLGEVMVRGGAAMTLYEWHLGVWHLHAYLRVEVAVGHGRSGGDH